MKILWFAAASLILATSGWAQSSGGASLSAEVNSVYPQVQKLYIDLHENPELSLHEVNTASKLAARVRELGYEVTEHVGGTGVVGVLRNGPGPTVMLRTELDALPVEEKTGLSYTSTVRTKDDAGHDVPVMHACGHDIHMAAWAGTATIMAHTKSEWHGTLVLIAQPAEELGLGAKYMIADGLFTRFPKPDVGVALHTTNGLPAGKVGGSGGRAGGGRMPAGRLRGPPTASARANCFRSTTGTTSTWTKTPICKSSSGRPPCCVLPAVSWGRSCPAPMKPPAGGWKLMEWPSAPRSRFRTTSWISSATPPPSARRWVSTSTRER